MEFGRFSASSIIVVFFFFERVIGNSEIDDYAMPNILCVLCRGERDLGGESIMSALCPPLFSCPRVGARRSVTRYTTITSGGSASTVSSLAASTSMAEMMSTAYNFPISRYHTDYDSCPITNGRKVKSSSMNFKRDQRKGNFSCPASAPVASASPLYENHVAKDTSSSDFYLKVLKAARGKFNQEIFLKSKDKDISLAKALLYIAAEDEAFMALNRQMDSPSILNETKDISSNSLLEGHYLELMPLAGKKPSQWLSELDAIAREVEAELVPRDIGCDLVEVLEAVNLVLFKLRCFKRLPVAVDPKFSYLHEVLSSGCGSAILLSIIYIEVCQRLGLTIFGSRVGEDFLIWPQTETPQELFKVTSGRSLFAIVNGRCVEDPKCMASDLNSSSLSALEIATNRDIIGIALANLIRLHWKRASRMSHGLMLASALRPVHYSSKQIDESNHPLLRTRDLRAASDSAASQLGFEERPWHDAILQQGVWRGSARAKHLHGLCPGRRGGCPRTIRRETSLNATRIKVEDLGYAGQLSATIVYIFSGSIQL
ncbi:hypothetical protein V2J09_017458 [Rumex salicifolius]